MTVFVIMEEDAFAENLRSIAKDSPTVGSTAPSDLFVRRPLRGLQHHKGSHANIRVFQNNGAAIPLLNSSKEPSTEVHMTANFILQSVSMPRQEKAQIVENFGEPFGFFSGGRAHFFQFSVMLINSPDFNWRSEWVANYENIFRGTKLVELGARIYISFDGLLLEGYMLNSNIDLNSNDPFLVPCSFGMWITGYEDLSLVGDTAFPGATLVDVDTGQSRDGLADRSAIYDNKDEYLLQQPDSEQLQRGDSSSAVAGNEYVFDRAERELLGSLVDDPFTIAALTRGRDRFDDELEWERQDADLLAANGANGDTTHGALAVEGQLSVIDGGSTGFFF